MRRTNIYLPAETIQTLKLLAASGDTSVAQLVRLAVDDFIHNHIGHTRAADSNRSTLSDILAEAQQRSQVKTALNRKIAASKDSQI